MKSSFLLVLICVTLLAITTSFSWATPIDLNDFTADPTTNVVIAGDGSNAVLTESRSLIAILLYNDPSLGNPNVIIPGVGTTLFFDYIFNEPVENDDGFWAMVFDSTTGISAGPGFEFYTSTPSSGTVSFDLSSLMGMTLGLEFQLASNLSDTGYDSVLTVSNIRLESSPIPEPATMLLLGTGLVGVAGAARRKKKTQP